MAGLLGAITWNLITWYFGLPSSSSHALIGGLVGSAARRPASRCSGTRSSTRSSSRWCCRRCSPSRSAFAGDARDHVDLPPSATRSRRNRGFRLAQTVSAAAMALGPRPPGRPEDDGRDLPGAAHRWVRRRAGDDLPLWVIFSAAAAISLGTWSGGWRIMRTLGRRIIHLDPPRGFAAESVAASVLYTTAYVYRGADLDHPHHHLRGDGRRRHQAPLRRPLGRRPLHPHRLGPHLPAWPASPPRSATGSPTSSSRSCSEGLCPDSPRRFGCDFGRS